MMVLQRQWNPITVIVDDQPRRVVYGGGSDGERSVDFKKWRRRPHRRSCAAFVLPFSIERARQQCRAN